LDDHRHDVLLAVDDEIHAEPERQAHDADDVLDHLVGGGDVERVAAGRERAKIGGGQQAALVHGAHPFLDAELVELGNSGSIRVHWARSSMINPQRSRPRSTTGKPCSAAAVLNAARASESVASPRPRSPPPAPLTL